MEKMIASVWSECLGVELETPFARLSYADSMLRYGSDKPDLRFGLEIRDVTEATRDSEFKVFGGASAVRCLTVPQELSRADLSELEERAKTWGAKGLAYVVYDESGEPRSPILKFLSEPELEAIRAEPSSTVLFGADEPAVVARVLGALRSHLGEQLGLIARDEWRFVWVSDFPMFDWSEDDQRWAAVHHPFTRPTPESEALVETDPGAAVAVAYDLVGNGEELGGGSVRIHESELQSKVFDVLQITPEQQRERFGFLLEALKMGAPPHGGIAFGIDRMLMVLAQEPNLRDTIAFPKNQAGVDPMTGAPSDADPAHLKELGIELLDSPV
jgi:aspartyl-tRNA synthetase